MRRSDENVIAGWVIKAVLILLPMGVVAQIPVVGPALAIVLAIVGFGIYLFVKHTERQSDE